MEIVILIVVIIGSALSVGIAINQARTEENVQDIKTQMAALSASQEKNLKYLFEAIEKRLGDASEAQVSAIASARDKLIKSMDSGFKKGLKATGDVNKHLSVHIDSVVEARDQMNSLISEVKHEKT